MKLTAYHKIAWNWQRITKYHETDSVSQNTMKLTAYHKIPWNWRHITKYHETDSVSQNNDLQSLGSHSCAAEDQLLLECDTNMAFCLTAGFCRMCTRSTLLWDVMWCWLAVTYRHLGRPIGSILGVKLGLYDPWRWANRMTGNVGNELPVSTA
jgi:hypothetical protein